MDRTGRAAPIRGHDVRDQDRGGPLARRDRNRRAARHLGRDRLADVPFGDYVQRWLRDHPRLGPRWRETCERNLRLHLQPLADLPPRQLTPVVVREWHAAALRGRGGRTSIAQSYRFLRAVLNTAVADGAIARNPCQIRGAGSDRAPERPVATPAQIAALANATSPRYRAAVLLGAWGGLRRGEILVLLRDDIDLEHGRVIVRRTRTELLSTGERFDAPPKTAAAYRLVALPPHIVPDIAFHLEHLAGAERVFVQRDGSPVRGDALRQAFERARMIRRYIAWRNRHAHDQQLREIVSRAKVACCGTSGPSDY